MKYITNKSIIFLIISAIAFGIALFLEYWKDRLILGVSALLFLTIAFFLAEKITNETDPAIINAKAKAKKKIRRNWVRIWVTYFAAGFVFILGAVLVIILVFNGDNTTGKLDTAKELYSIILPVATGILAYWLRQPKSYFK